jgi:hypothetical protein
MTAAQLAWVITIGLSVVLAVLTWRLDNPKKATVGIMGLVAAGLGATVTLYFEIDAIRADQDAALRRVVPTLRSQVWNSVVQDIADYDRRNPTTPFEEILSESLRQAIASNFNQAKDGQIVMSDKNEVVLVTLKLLGAAQRKVQATSYIDPHEWWVSSIAPTYEEGLKTTRQRIGLYQRIFIVGSIEEGKALKPIMEMQQRAGVEVKYICASSLTADKRDDFIIIDSSVAGELILNERRQFSKARFFPTTVRAQDFEKRFENLWIAAIVPSRTNLLPCPTTFPK